MSAWFLRYRESAPPGTRSGFKLTGRYPMSQSSFQDRLRAGERLLGTLLQIPHPAVAVHIGGQGFDWLCLDGEHGGYGPVEVAATRRVLQGSVPCLVRVPSQAADILEAVAASGADGLIAVSYTHLTLPTKR